MVLLEGLCRLKQYIDIPFDVVAITVDPQFTKDTDYSAVQQLCDAYQVPFVLQKTELAEIIFSEREESNPCSLCARMRRGILHNATVEHGCNKLALGHHADDAVETFLMNLTQEGRLGCFQPVTYLSRKDITMIRPMILLSERQVADAAMRHSLPVIPSGCPVDGKTRREDVKQWLKTTEQNEFPELRKRIIGAIHRSGLDGW